MRIVQENLVQRTLTGGLGLATLLACSAGGHNASDERPDAALIAASPPQDPAAVDSMTSPSTESSPETKGPMTDSLRAEDSAETNTSPGAAGAGGASQGRPDAEDTRGMGEGASKASGGQSSGAGASAIDPTGTVGGSGTLPSPALGGAGGQPVAAAGGGGAGPDATGGIGGAGGLPPAATGGAGGRPPAAGDTEYPQCFAGNAMPHNPGLKLDPEVQGHQTLISNDNYIAMLIGPDRPECITDQVALDRLAELEQGLREIVEVVGFPAFPEWEQGHYLNWVILNSGIPGASIPAEGGHQGNRWGHMNFESTQTAPCVWDEYQAGGSLHECVHALQAELWVFNNPASGWAHESHDNYLLTQRQALAHNRYTMGSAASLVLQMPHVPIESMGLFTDDTVAGPSDQGANGRTYISTQIRYGQELFFLSLSQTMGRGFVNCLWMEPEPRNRKSIFQVLQDVGGKEATGIAVQAFAAKSAILDFGNWTETMRTQLSRRWDEQLWFYTFPEGDGTQLFRPPTKTTPHHQGRNTIPIKLAANTTSVTVEFIPDDTGSAGTPAELKAQLVYRNAADEPVYGPIFSSGESRLELTGGVRGNIVNLVVAVTHANAEDGSDDGSGKGFDAQEHFSYQARIVKGGTVAPRSTRPW